MNSIILDKEEIINLRDNVMMYITESNSLIEFKSFNIMEFISKCYKYKLDIELEMLGIVVNNRILKHELENNFIDVDMSLDSISLVYLYSLLCTLEIEKSYNTIVTVSESYNAKLEINEVKNG